MATTCRSCGAPIRWALTEKGKRMPLNVPADPAGTVIITGTNGTEYTCAVVRTNAVPGERWTSHYATCPQAQQWRKQKKQGNRAQASIDDANREMGIDPLAGDDVGAK